METPGKIRQRKGVNSMGGDTDIALNFLKELLCGKITKDTKSGRIQKYHLHDVGCGRAP